MIFSKAIYNLLQPNAALCFKHIAYHNGIVIVSKVSLLCVLDIFG